jgi:GNAT superfamily N-acetyltransferase
MAERDDQFWANYFGIRASDWQEAGVSICPHAGLEGYKGVWCFRRLDRTVVSAPAGWIDHLQARLSGIDQDLLMQESFIRELFGADFDRVIGPAFQGSLLRSRFRQQVKPEVRFLGPSDEAGIETFRAECNREDWESSGLDEATQYVAGCFDRQRIVAMAGYRGWSDEAGDPCVTTLPSHRGRGCGLCTMSAVVDRALAAGKLLLCQTLEANSSAVNLALRLGYEQYARHVAIRLKTKTPSGCV